MQSLFIPYITLSYLLYSATGALGARIETPLCQHIEWMCRTLLMPTVNATTYNGCDGICYLPEA